MFITTNKFWKVLSTWYNLKWIFLFLLFFFVGRPNPKSDSFSQVSLQSIFIDESKNYISTSDYTMNADNVFSFFLICIDSSKWRKGDIESSDRLKAAKVWEKVQLMRALWSHSSAYKSPSPKREQEFFNINLWCCLCKTRWQLQLQAYELEMQMREPHLQPLNSLPD